MDKADFIKLAPTYYELAVLVLVWKSQRHLSEESIRAEYEVGRGDDPEPETLLGSDVLLRNALRVLAANNAISVIDDPFGPTLYARSEGINEYIEKLEANPASPFHKSMRSPSQQQWVLNALVKLDKTYNELALTEAELEKPVDEWAPIPIERDNEAFLRAEAAVNKTVEEVEKNNGYASEYPEERNLVLERLKLLSTKLKTAKEVSIAYVKANGIDMLRRLSQRFGGAMIGKLADAAATALLAWLGLK